MGNGRSNDFASCCLKILDIVADVAARLPLWDNNVRHGRVMCVAKTLCCTTFAQLLVPRFCGWDIRNCWVGKGKQVGGPLCVELAHLIDGRQD